MNQPQEKKEFREFFVAETLKGDLHIFRKNHEGGGLTKFVEHAALVASQNEIAELKEQLSDCNALYLTSKAQRQEIIELKRKLETRSSDLHTLTQKYNHLKEYHDKILDHNIDLNSKVEFMNQNCISLGLHESRVKELKKFIREYPFSMQTAEQIRLREKALLLLTNIGAENE
jgi:hypothetical protein